ARRARRARGGDMAVAARSARTASGAFLFCAATRSDPGIFQVSIPVPFICGGPLRLPGLRGGFRARRRRVFLAAESMENRDRRGGGGASFRSDLEAIGALRGS